ncbi:hypothetical protein C8R42DRAFT_728231 [Lentinula raphanica]|nr:hypothetical protein C8R42DRAFT_728231 [Lentinula raphanica]
MFHRILSRPMWLQLAIAYLRVALVTALPVPTGSDLSQPSPSEPKGLSITLGYYDFIVDHFLKLGDVEELRLAEMKAREENEGRGKEENAEEKMEVKKPERTRRLKTTQRTNYAVLTPVLCFGIEACFAYQKDLNGGPGIKKDLRLNLSTKKYHKRMLASLVPDAPQFEISKEALFDTFSTHEKLQFALTEHRIDIMISEGKSLCSAMLQFMEKMKAKFRTDHLEKKESMNALWEELTGIKLTLVVNHGRRTGDQPDKPLLDLLYNERHSGSDADLSASSSTRKRPLPMSSLNTGAPGQSGPSQSHLYPDHPSKMSKTETGTESPATSHRPNTGQSGLAASRESEPSHSSTKPTTDFFRTIIN